jgi:hypothetical protein
MHDRRHIFEAKRGVDGFLNRLVTDFGLKEKKKSSSPTKQQQQ